MPSVERGHEARTVAEAMVQELVDAGATHVFGGHGAAVIPLIKAIVEHPRLHWVCTRNEGGAALAGAAAAKLSAASSGIGVVLATSGPGATNLTTGLIAAARDNLPLVALTGLKPSYKSGLTDFQDLEISRLFSGALSFSRRVMHPLQAPQLTRDALAHALTQRTAVHLAIPEDIQGAILQPEQQLQAQGLQPTLNALHADPASSVAIQNVVDFLMQRRRSRMLIAIGHLAVEEGPKITALAEQLNAPMVTRLDAKGTVDESHPLCLGVVGVHGNPGLEVSRDIVESADIVISCGVEDQMLGQLVLADGMQVKDLVLIQPDMANFSARFSMGAALIGNLGGSLSALLTALKEADGESTADGSPGKASGQTPTGPEEEFPITLAWDHFIHGHWRDRSDDTTRPFLVTETSKLEDSAYCHPSHVYAALNAFLGPQDTLAIDVGDQTLWAAMLGHLTRGTRTLSDEFMGTMGYALPAALAASLLRPGGTHVAVAGDGAFQMTLNELATAVQHGCRVVAIVFCNMSLGRVKYGSGSETIVGADIGNPDFVALARSYGAEGVRVSRPDEAERAIRTAWEAKGVFVVEVTVDPSLRAEMAKIHDMRSVAALARRVGDLLPESLAGLRRPQAMQGLMQHVREKHRKDGAEGNSSPALTESDVETIRGMLERWRAEYAEMGNDLERKQSGLSRFVMQKIHKLRSTECSPGTCGCWEPTNRSEGGGDKDAPPPVKLTKGEIAMTEKTREESSFPGRYPAQLLLEKIGVDVGDGEAFAGKWTAAVSHLFDAKPNGRQQWEEFLDSGLSNGRALRWDIMSIAPSQSFPLHAHANIEAIYVAKGTLHELRLCGPVPTTHFRDDASGHPLPPDLSNRTATFERLAFPVGSFIVNDVGSVHQSYSEEDGTELLLLWGGCHANITPSHMPKTAYENGFREVALKAGQEPNPPEQKEGSK